MAQFLRPDGVISQGSWIGGFADIDEATPNDADRAYSQNNPNGSIFEVSLSNPASNPASGTYTVRYRHGQVNNGTLDGTGTATALDAIIVQGTTIIATDAQQAPGGSYVTRTWTPNLSAITDWTDVRIRFTASGGAGNPANRRGVAVSWAEIEIPDGIQSGPVGLATSSSTAFALGRSAGIGISAETDTAIALPPAGPDVESFDPANKDPDITLSNSDRTATNTVNAVNNSVFGETSRSSGKWYFEVSTTQVGDGDSHKVGLVNLTATPTNYEMGSNNNSVAYRGFEGNVSINNVAQATYTAWTTPSTAYTIMVAVDVTNQIAWFGLNGTWNGDPAAGTGGVGISALGAGALKAAVGMYNSTGNAGVLTGAFTADDLSFAIPSGFAAWDGTGAVQSGPVGLAIEGSSAFAGGSARPADAAVETSLALALGQVVMGDVGLAASTNTALALSSVAGAPAGIAVDASESLAMGSGRPAGMAEQTDDALALASSIAGDVGLSLQADEAIALAPVVIAPTGPAQQTEVALALGPVSSLGISLAEEAALALALSGVQSLAAGVAIQLDEALALSSPAGSAAGISTETTTALALGGVQIVPAGLSTETSSALALGQSALIGTASEISTALALAGGTASGAGIAAQSDTAFALGCAVSVGIAEEGSIALGLSAIQTAPVSAANDNQQAIGLAAVAIRQVGGVDGACLALALAGGQGAGVASENSTSFALSSPNIPSGPAPDRIVLIEEHGRSVKLPNSDRTLILPSHRRAA